MGLNKSDLVNAIAQETGLTKVDSEKALRATLDSISKELENGGSVTLIGFGTFSVLEKSERTGINPRTRDAITIPAKRVPKFKPGKALMQIVDQGKKG